MPLAAGTLLGPYEILAPIGAGGMGEVYRARDTKLDREVAIKVLPSALARDPERLARFEREAKVLASLNHPNIAQIYGIEESDSGRALVMELVPGHTLQSPLTLDEALRIAAQIADALEAAHDKGIVHRDLKPANIMITPAGVVKVLDFGLAATTPSSPASGDPNNSPTLTMGSTQAGMILGTASYMSPEQAAGQPVDKRADIWSFGVVLYEMLTGQRLFTGDSVAHILADVLRAPIDFDKPPATTPRAIRDLLKRCVDRDVKTRLRDIGEARIAIHNLGKEPEVVTPAPDHSRLIWLAWGVAAAAILAALTVSFVHYREQPPQVIKASLLPPEKAVITLTGIPAVSPDGLRLAFVAKGDRDPLLWVRELDSISAHPVPGTENASYPFWSPDSRWLGFFADNKLKKIDVTGGPPQTLCDATTARGGSWSQNGVIIFATNGSSTFRVAATGGSVAPLTTLDPNAGVTGNRFPWFLPDGHHFLVTVDNTNPEKVAVKVGDLDSKELKQVINAPSNAVYVSPGYLLFVRDRTLMAQHFDPGKREATGDAVPLAEQVDPAGSIASQNQFSASQNGILVYSSAGGAEMEQLTWFDHTGKVLGTVGPPGTIDGVAISPDGKTVAADRRDAQTKTADIWLHDLARGAASRFTFVPSNFFPIWSPDGSHLAFYSTRSGGGKARTYQKAIGANARDELLHKPLGDPPRITRVEDWSRDGGYLIEETEGGGKTANDIWVVPMSSGAPYPYLQTDFRERLAKLSPDGRWLSYQSDESNRDEIYVQSFPMPGGKWQVSLNGGSHAVWSRDGKQLYFIGADHKMMAAQVRTSAGKFEASVPQALFEVHMPNDTNINAWYDVAPDGRFLIPTQVGEAPVTPLIMVVNWQAALK